MLRPYDADVTPTGAPYPAGLPNGTEIDVVIVDAAPGDAIDGADGGSVVVEAAVATGEHKGELIVLHMAGPGPLPDPLDLLGLAATVTVVAGRPRLTL